MERGSRQDASRAQLLCQHSGWLTSNADIGIGCPRSTPHSAGRPPSGAPLRRHDAGTRHGAAHGRGPFRRAPGTSGAPSTSRCPRRGASRAPGPERGRRTARSRARRRSRPSLSRRAKPDGEPVDQERCAFAWGGGPRHAGGGGASCGVRLTEKGALQAASTPTLGAKTATCSSSMAVTSLWRFWSCVAARAPILFPGRRTDISPSRSPPSSSFQSPSGGKTQIDREGFSSSSPRRPTRTWHQRSEQGVSSPVVTRPLQPSRSNPLVTAYFLAFDCHLRKPAQWTRRKCASSSELPEPPHTRHVTRRVLAPRTGCEHRQREPPDRRAAGLARSPFFYRRRVDVHRAVTVGWLMLGPWLISLPLWASWSSWP